MIDENPYKGLRSFGQSDARDFFGRERFIDRLVSRLSRAGSAGRFVAVVGPSGSGKSSVVRAGLLPALRQGGCARVGYMVHCRDGAVQRTHSNSSSVRCARRAVMEFIASPDYGHASAEAGIGFIPANTQFDLDAIPNATERRIAELTRTALVNDGFRFDASDMMPVEVGAGTFWTGMVDWFVDGPEALDDIMAASRPAGPTTNPRDDHEPSG